MLLSSGCEIHVVAQLLSTELAQQLIRSKTLFKDDGKTGYTVEESVRGSVRADALQKLEY